MMSVCISTTNSTNVLAPHALCLYTRLILNVFLTVCTGTTTPNPIQPDTPTPPNVTPSLKPLPPPKPVLSPKPLSPSTSSSTSGDEEQSLSTRLKPEEKSEIRDLLKQYVPHEVIQRSPIWGKFSFRCTRKKLSKSTESLKDSQVFRDGVAHSPPYKSPSTSELRSQRAPLKHQRFSYPSHSHPDYNHGKRRAATTCILPPQDFDHRNEDLEWVLLDAKSVTDSGTCSGSSLDSSLDIDIGDFSTQIPSER